MVMSDDDFESLVDDLFGSATTSPSPAAPDPLGAQVSAVAIPSDLYIRGRNTFAVKEELKILGCKWDAVAKCWYALDQKMAAEAREVVRQGPKVAAGAVPVQAHDLSRVPTSDLVRELRNRGDLVKTIGAAPMVSALRRQGMRVQEEAGDSLADIVVAEAPTIDDLTAELDELVKVTF